MELNKELIKKLRNGEIAIDYTEKHNLELLQSVLKEAFPDDSGDIYGIKNYYFQWNYKSTRWQCSDEAPSLPTYKLKDFILPEKKLLAESFSVYASTLEEAKIITEKQKEICGGIWTIKVNHYYRFSPKSTSDKFGASHRSYKSSYHSTFEIKEEYTFSEFIERYNNTKQETMEKKIIGYKAPFNMVGSTDFINKGAIFTLKPGAFFYTNDGVIKSKNPLPKEIVETWEPVFEEEYKIGDCVIFKPANTEYVGIISNLNPIKSNLWTGIGKSFNVVTEESSFSKIVRKATPEEAKLLEIQLPRINNTKGNFEENFIIYGCAKFHEDIFYAMHSVNTHKGNRTVKEFKLNTDITITYQEVEQIVKFLENNK